jgi:hypothetical protein
LISRFSIFLLTLLLIGCAPQPPNIPSFTPTPVTPTSLPSTFSEAYEVLVNFLTLLHTRDYTNAVPLYGGEYEQLQVFNTEIDPNDHVALWTWACDHQLLQCLEVRSATFRELRGDSYIFQVEFNNPDGSLFVLGPCCGANETEMPPVSQFEYTVSRKTDHKFAVMNMPPYVP